MRSEDITIADRSVKIITGSSQTIHVIAEDRDTVVYEHSYRISQRNKFITGAAVEQRAFESIEAFFEFLTSERGAEKK